MNIYKNKKKNIIMIGSLANYMKHLCENLLKKKYQIFFLNPNIYELEKNKNTSIYPISSNLEELNILQHILKKKIKNIEGIIINTSEPYYAQPFEQIDSKLWINTLTTNIYLNINIIKNNILLLKKSKNPFITIILHQHTKKIKAFFGLNNCINNALIALMKTLTKEYKNISNIKINCITTENIKISYKKEIYPYKINKNFKNINNLIKTNMFLMKKKIKNKIITL